MNARGRARLVLDEDQIASLYMGGESEPTLSQWLGISDPTVHRHLQWYGVGLRSQREAVRLARNMVLDEDQIASLYTGGESESVLCDWLGIGHSTVHRHLQWHGVDLRGQQEASDLVRHKSFPVTESFLELLDGLLLGDAWIEMKIGEGRLAIQQRADRRGWLSQIRWDLMSYGVESSLSPRVARNSTINGIPVRGSASFQLRTHNYTPLTRQRARWYPYGSKRVPRDVRLTPRALAHWYWGDGGLANDGYAVMFSTDGLERTEVEFLIARLCDLYGWKPNIYKHQRGFKISLALFRDREEFVEMVRPFCPQCFRYKLAIKRRAPVAYIEKAEQLVRLTRDGWTQKEIGSKLGMSQGWVSWALKRLEKTDEFCDSGA